MTEENNGLPERVTKVVVEGKEIYLVGTAHISKQSVEDVRMTIEAVRPDSIAIELCAGRHKAITDKDSWKKMNILKVIKEKKALFLLIQLTLSAFYRRLGEQFDVQPGAEMIEGINCANESGAKLVLADRSIEITLKRVWGYLGFWNKVKLLTQMVVGVFVGEEIDEDMIENMKKKDQLESIMGEFAEKFGEIKKRLIDERDIYLSQKIREAQGSKIVAVVGAGHVPGICEHIQRSQSLDELEKIPPKSIVPTIIKWAIPVLIVGLFVYAFITGDTQRLVENIYIWVLVNGTLSAVGTIIAFGHPLTVLASFIGAPLTSLNPAIAAGWVAGLVQAWVRPPTVADFQDLPAATSTVKGFWTNPVTRILLVVVLANLGSMLGTYISIMWIAMRLGNG